MLPALVVPVAMLSVLASLALLPRYASWRVRKSRETRIADARDGELVQIQGHAVASELGATPAPISGHAALCVCTTFRTPRRERHGAQPNVSDNLIVRDFIVEDADGHKALVRTAGAVIVGGYDRVLEIPESVDEPDARVEAYLRERGSSVEHLRAPGLVSRCALHVYEQRIAEGDEVWVVGRVVRTGATTGDVYRGSASSEITLVSAAEGRTTALWSGLYVGREDVRAMALTSPLVMQGAFLRDLVKPPT